MATADMTDEELREARKWTNEEIDKKILTIKIESEALIKNEDMNKQIKSIKLAQLDRKQRDLAKLLK